MRTVRVLLKVLSVLLIISIAVTLVSCSGSISGNSNNNSGDNINSDGNNNSNNNSSGNNNSGGNNNGNNSNSKNNSKNNGSDSSFKNPIAIFVEGEQVLIDTLPEVKDGEIFVPIKKIADQFDHKTGWNKIIQSTYDSRGDNKLDDRSYQINDTEMVPLNFITEVLKVPAYYNPDTDTLFINSPHSEGLKTERLTKGNYNYNGEIVDLNNSVLVHGEDVFVFKGVEENGKFMVFTTNYAGDFSKFYVNFIFEDGFAQKQTFKETPGNIYNRVGLNTNGRPINLINDFDENTVGNESFFLPNNKFLYTCRFNNDNFYSHGNIVRMDISYYNSSISIKNIDYNKKLKFLDYVPVLGNQTLNVSGDSVKSLENADIRLNSFVIRDETFKTMMGHDYREIITKNVAVVELTFMPKKDHKFEYEFSIMADDFYYGFRDSFKLEAALYEGVNKDLTLHLGAVPIIDTNKVYLNVKDLKTNETATFEFVTGPETAASGNVDLNEYREQIMNVINEFNISSEEALTARDASLLVNADEELMEYFEKTIDEMIQKKQLYIGRCAKTVYDLDSFSVSEFGNTLKANISVKETFDSANYKEGETNIKTSIKDHYWKYTLIYDKNNGKWIIDSYNKLDKLEGSNLREFEF